MNALKKGLSQLNDVQLQRVLKTPEEKLLFTGGLFMNNRCWPMVAGLPEANIRRMLEGGGGSFRKAYGNNFHIDPATKGVHYSFELIKAGYNGTIKTIKGILDERSKKRAIATGWWTVE